jgi:hypothetical protein
MSDVFISYKREDEPRVAKIAEALIAEGLDVWWDRGLPGGESWRTNIEKELHGARCVVVAWSKASVAPEGHFVRDEAGQALKNGLLVPVFIDRVNPPVGFGEIQAVDLIGWRGNRADPFFQDLVAAIRAKLDGVPAPRAKGPAARALRRVSFGGAVAVVAGITVAMGTNFGNVATHGCTLAAMQPGLSDTCGAIGIGERPTREERLFWDARKPGSCEDIRRYINRYHDRGAYLLEANALLSARHVDVRDRFVSTTTQLALYVMQAETGAETEAASRTKALVVAHEKSLQSCRAFTATTRYRLEGADVDAQSWRCERIGGEVGCSLEGQSICHVAQRESVEGETCGN